ncbi:retrovirus-related pol polyprotein from transposon TNT 1-94, partial [Tanacetum coccineum]
TSGQISSGLDLTYAPSAITTQKPTEYELDLLFEAMHDDYIGSQPSATPRTTLAAQATQDVDELETQQQQHVQHKPAIIADNVLNAMFDENTFINPFATPSTSVAESSSLHHVYKLKKALYGSKQAQRAWYDELLMFLLQNHFFKGTIDLTLFIRHFDDDILVGTVNMGLWYTKDSGFELTGFLDADYAVCKDTFKSTSGGAQFLGKKLVSLSSKKQDYMALSIAEAEYVSC